MTKFEIGKKYRRDGFRVGWTCIGLHEGRPIFLLPDGITTHFVPTEAIHFWNEYHEPVTVEGWVNVYDPPMVDVTFFSTKEAAKDIGDLVSIGKKRKLIATVFVKGTSDETR